MAPEVFQREYGLEADMWSAGMMLYQCMTCRFPFWPSIQACREKSLDEVARAVILDDILLNFGPWLEMSQEVRHVLVQRVVVEPSCLLHIRPSSARYLAAFGCAHTAADAAAVRRIVPSC